jgi:hypothetical protein
VLSDADGVPLVVQTTPANVPDQNQLPSLLEAMPKVPGPRGRPRSKPEAIVGDRAYGTKEMVALMMVLGIVCLLAPRGDDTHGSGLGAVRFVIERTLAHFGQFRRLKLCYERTGACWQYFHDLAASLLVCNRLRRYRLLQF